MVPPLRDRPEELRALAQLFLERTAAQLGRSRTPELSEPALALLESYAWPGNVRELKNVIERAVLLAPHDRIEPMHLPVERMSLPLDLPAPAALSRSELAERRESTEALKDCGGNQTRAAKMLGIGRRTLTDKLNKYGLPRPKKV